MHLWSPVRVPCCVRHLRPMYSLPGQMQHPKQSRPLPTILPSLSLTMMTQQAIPQPMMQSQPPLMTASQQPPSRQSLYPTVRSRSPRQHTPTQARRKSLPSPYTTVTRSSKRTSIIPSAMITTSRSVSHPLRSPEWAVIRELSPRPIRFFQRLRPPYLPR